YEHLALCTHKPQQLHGAQQQNYPKELVRICGPPVTLKKQIRIWNQEPYFTFQPLPRKFVFYFRWHFGINFSLNQAILFGLGKMFGFQFKENFQYPYISKSISEFWQRWHISLGSWFKEYVYIPLGGNRVGKWKLIRNLFIVWFLTGLWHGASWNFVLWGLYFGT
ncbi:MBOAT family O-acyltransferase, partial [Lachnoclostridium sp.]|uniref:MBOAT family O-acyltransferase n=1 Tax=Lachnoclostridium sp. TaxID=2028282 RepID=UPI002F41FCFB